MNQGGFTSGAVVGFFIGVLAGFAIVIATGATRGDGLSDMRQEAVASKHAEWIIETNESNWEIGDEECV